MTDLGYCLTSELHEPRELHQIGPDQQGFLGFYKREILPSFG